MGLRVNTNVFSINAQRNLGNVSARLSKNFQKLSSGLRITTAADDAAGLGISERLRAQIRSLDQAGRNTEDGISVVQTAEGALNEVSSNLVRLRELAIQSSNGTLSTGDRTSLQNEFSALISEIDRVATQTDFNGTNLLNSTTTLDVQVGTESGETIGITLTDARASAGLGLSGGTFNLNTATNASAALATIDTAIDSVTSARSSLGAVQNRLSSASRSISNTRENLSASESRIRDVDIAKETADLTRNSILQQAALSILGQANVAPQSALGLLG